MPYQRGPFRLLPSTAIVFDQVNYNFTADATDLATQFDANTADYDLAMLQVITWNTDVDDPIPDIDILGGLAEVLTQVSVPIIDGFDGMLAGVDAADVLLSTAVTAAPAEAWTDAPAPFQLPANGPITAPGVPAGAFQPGTTTGTPGSPVGGTAPLNRALTLLNVTRYGQTDFFVTDTWLIQATGQAGEAVSVHAFVDGISIGSETIGTIGADGRFEKSGTFQPGDVGSWREDWTIGSTVVATLTFLVSGVDVTL